MARAPRSTGVPKTSGQGISRGIYQKNYALSGGAIGGGVKKARVPKGDGNRYAKGSKYDDDADDFNIEFGGMFKPEDVKPLGEDKPPKGWKDERQQAKKMKGPK